MKNKTENTKKQKRESIINKTNRAPLSINSLSDLTTHQNALNERVIKSLKNLRASALEEMNKAFEYAINYCKEQETTDDANGVLFFLSVLSDTLNVAEDSIRAVFAASEIELPSPRETKKEMSDEQEEAESIDTKNEHSIENYTLYNIDGKHQLVKDFEDKQSALDIGPKGYTWRRAQLTNLPSETSSQSLKDWIASKMSDYNISSELWIHPLYQNLCVSIYPKEKSEKVSLYARFSPNYMLPEKLATYARPILDLEIVPRVGPCVRCYLALADRPRPEKTDKDIIQDAKGKLIFQNVNVMNFGDALRSMTWVEDYIKNDEHPSSGEKDSPIVRSFLITLETYQNLLKSGSFLEVDSDRAPAQVRMQQNQFFNPDAVPRSLTSFMNKARSTPQDGKVKGLEELCNHLLGHSIHPVDIADKNFIAHQHGRPIEQTDRLYDSYTDESAIKARTLERNLAGFALEPKSKIRDGASFLRFFYDAVKSDKQELKTKPHSCQKKGF